MSEVVSKPGIIRNVYEKMAEQGSDFTLKQVDQIVNAVFDVVEDTIIEGGSVRIPNVGLLFVKQSASRVWKRPDGERVHVTPKPSVGFKVSPSIRDKLKK